MSDATTQCFLQTLLTRSLAVTQCADSSFYVAAYDNSHSPTVDNNADAAHFRARELLQLLNQNADSDGTENDENDENSVASSSSEDDDTTENAPHPLVHTHSRVVNITNIYTS